MMAVHFSMESLNVFDDYIKGRRVVSIIHWIDCTRPAEGSVVLPLMEFSDLFARHLMRSRQPYRWGQHIDDVELLWHVTGSKRLLIDSSLGPDQVLIWSKKEHFCTFIWIYNARTYKYSNNIDKSSTKAKIYRSPADQFTAIVKWPNVTPCCFFSVCLSLSSAQPGALHASLLPRTCSQFNRRRWWKTDSPGS